MKQIQREPDILKLLICVPILQVFYIFFLRRPVEAVMGIQAPLDRWFWVTLAIPLFLMVYTWIPWWRQRLGRFYLPSFLAISSIYLILDKYLTLAWFILPAQQGAGVLFLTLKLWVVILTVTILVAWQYSRAWVLWVSLTLCIVDAALSLPFLRAGTPLFSLTLTLFVARLIFITAASVGAQWLVNRQRQQRAALTEANRKLMRYATATEQLAASHERNRLAHELHDTLAHSLSAVAVQLEAVQALWDVNPCQAHQILDRALQATQSGLTESRRALQALRASPLEDLGLALAVSDLAKSAAARTSLRLDLDVHSHLESLAPELEQCIYRVAQEALTNTTRHAEATSLRLSLRREAEGVTLTVADDGRGFDPAAVKGVRYGLQGLRERSELVGATLQVSTALQAGTIVRLVIPTAEAGT